MSRLFVAMTTWEPEPALLDRQLESLARQTYADWGGVVVDDASRNAEAIAARVAHEPRLRFVEGARRVGFYRNFERALALAPASCDHVALCDQDDYWVPEKLARQVAELERRPAAQLCYTDLRLVDAAGGLIAETFWRGRAHGRSFREILYNNVVTGAAAVFRRDLLNVALPFPSDPGGAFHDHWLALCALARGGLLYLDRALVDYTQHSANAIGAQGFDHVGRGALARFLLESVAALARPRRTARELDNLAAYAVSTDAKLQSFAGALATRVPALPPDARRALRPFLRRSRFCRILDMAGLTLPATVLAREETNLAPLKIPMGLCWASLRGTAGASSLHNV